MLYKIEAFGGSTPQPMGEATTSTQDEMKQVVASLLDLVTMPDQVIRITVSCTHEAPPT